MLFPPAPRHLSTLSCLTQYFLVAEVKNFRGITANEALSFNPEGHVYSGRGQHVKVLNASFLQKIHRDSPDYVATSSNNTKRQIACKIYDEITQAGGRFFQ